MSKYLLRSYEGKAVCPKCKDTMQSYPDEVFGAYYDCINCASRFYQISPGLTEHEYVVSNNYSEALIELSALDDLR